MKLTWSLLPISRFSLHFNVHTDETQPQMVRFDGQMVAVDDVVSLLFKSGMSSEDVLIWLEHRMTTGTFRPTEVAYAN